MLPSSFLHLLPPSAEDARAFRSGASDEKAHPVLTRWRRALALGRRPEGPSDPVGLDESAVRDRREVLGATLREVSEAAATLRTFDVTTLLADGEGVLVWSDPGAFGDRAAGARLVTGARWSECARGTNAIGTALAEARDVAVIGAAHFEEANRGLFCYATPIVDAYGEILGVFDASGDVRDDDPLVGALVSRVGAALRAALRQEAWATVGAVGAMERMVERCAVPALLVERAGVRRMNDKARDLLRGSVEEPTLSFSRLEALVRSGRSESVRGHRLQLEPVLGAGGRVLGVVACLDPERPTKTLAATPPDVDTSAFDGIFGEDPAIVAVKTRAAKFAPTQIPVLLLAETGTGKELLAKATHRASRRARGPFVAINCGALSPQLLESELFGFAAGSFTGARQGGSEGKISAAHGGTLFLDEIGEMSPSLQAMLLRVLEDGTYCRIGETVSRRGDFRLLGATCRDLPAMVRSGAFRSDLFYRLHGANLVLPPLRLRTDKGALAAALLAELAAESDAHADGPPTLAADALEWIDQAAWPGNVRELKNTLRYALLLSEGGEIHARDFPPPIEGAATSREVSLEARIEDALRAHGGNRVQAAKALGIARSTLYRVLSKRE
jgi:sigma-54 dependent transcriptional regulator, acetoin dehydrogenase operon transcriptional activator AcoR